MKSRICLVVMALVFISAGQSFASTLLEVLSEGNKERFYRLYSDQVASEFYKAACERDPLFPPDECGFYAGYAANICVRRVVGSNRNNFFENWKVFEQMEIGEGRTVIKVSNDTCVKHGAQSHEKSCIEAVGELTLESRGPLQIMSGVRFIDGQLCFGGSR